MASPLMSLRKTSWIPVLAVLSAFFLVAGQIFNCCRFNETVSEKVGKAAKAVGVWVLAPSTASEPRLVKTHAGCHGHPPSEESQAAPVPRNQGESHLQSRETCLSEIAFEPDALQPASVLTADFFPEVPAPIPEDSFHRPSRIEKPRPQNKSSPPVYLLTRRLLV